MEAIQTSTLEVAKKVVNAVAPQALAMDLTKFRPSHEADAPFWTTNTGAPVWDNDHSLTVGARGPVLLEDYHLLEKLAQFHRERIPERVVHARGASAKGYFEVSRVDTRHQGQNLPWEQSLASTGEKLVLNKLTGGHFVGSLEIC